MTRAIVDLSLQGPMDHLRLTWQAGETLLSSVPFEEDAESTRYNILLSVQELLTNVLRHAYSGDESKPIHVRMEASPQGFAFELRDQGTRFDPTAHETSLPLQQDPDAEPAENGGYGLVIVKMVMDDLFYRFADGWNIVRATRSIYAQVPVATTENEA